MVIYSQTHTDYSSSRRNFSCFLDTSSTYNASDCWKPTKEHILHLTISQQSIIVNVLSYFPAAVQIIQILKLIQENSGKIQNKIQAKFKIIQRNYSNHLKLFNIAKISIYFNLAAIIKWICIGNC